MNTQQLRCFLAVAENLSFARAAEEVFLTQPTVTHQINSLENELGVKLFYRTRRTVSLTQEGLIFYDDAKGIFLKEQEAISKLRFHSIQENPVLGLGVTSATELEALLPVLARLAVEQVFRPYLRILPPKSIWDVLCGGGLDCMLAYQGDYPEMPQIQVTPIRTSRLVCILSRSSPLARAERIGAGELAQEPFLTCSPAALPAAAAAVENALLPTFPPDRVIYCESIEATLALARIGFGAAVLPEDLCADAPELVKIPFDIDVHLEYSLFSKKDTARNKMDILRRLQALLRAGTAENSGQQKTLSDSSYT